MKLVNTLAWLSLAGALVVSATSAQATVTFKSSVTVKLTATIQATGNVPTSDGYTTSTDKATIVNKDLLAAFEDWWDTTLPDGANFALDTDYNICIVNKDGDILFDVDDLDGFLNIDYDGYTADGRYREDAHGYSDKFTYGHMLYVTILGSNDRSAELESNNDLIFLAGNGVESYSDKYNADKDTYTESDSDKANVSGYGTVEDSDAVVSGTVSSKYSYKDK